MANEAEVKQTLQTYLPEGTTLSEVKLFAAQHGLDCPEFANNVLHCSALAASGMRFVRAKWLIEFHFDDKLTAIEVTKGLIGP